MIKFGFKSLIKQWLLASSREPSHTELVILDIIFEITSEYSWLTCPKNNNMKKTYKDLPLDAKLNILEYFTPDELVDAHRIPNSTILESQDFIVDFQQVRDFQYTQVDVPFSVPQFLDLVKKTSWNIFIKVVCSNIPVDFDIGEAVKDIFHDPHRSIKIIVENISTVDIFGEKKSFIDSIFVEHKVTTSSCTHFQTLFKDFKSIY